MPDFPRLHTGTKDVEVRRALQELNRILALMETEYGDIDYAYVSGNDDDTDVSAVELETLTDGSNADALHIHAETGIGLTDPNADRIVFWDDGADGFGWLLANTGLAISGTNLNLTADYSVISGNDAATDVTGAELESLTDGSDTSLHNHASLYSALGHTHDDRYYTETELDAGQLDNRYYTETEIDGFSFLTAESDPDFHTALDALSGLIKCDGAGNFSAVTDNSANWNTAYGWGDHAGAGYLTSVTAHAVDHESGGTDQIDHDALFGFVANEHIDWTGASAGTIHASNYVDNDTTYTAGDGLTLAVTEFQNTDKGSTAVSTHESTYNHANYDTAYSWGDHAGLYLEDITGESIGDLSDVDLTGIADGKILKYNNTSGNFEVADESGGGIDWTVSQAPTVIHADNYVDNDTTYVSSDFDHNSLTNTHNLTTDIDHDALTGFVANEHIDWTGASQNFLTSGMIESVNTAKVRLLTAATYTNVQWHSGTTPLYAVSAGMNCPGVAMTNDFVVSTYNTTDSWVEKFRITNAGNVGVGTGSPDARLHIAGDTNTICKIGDETLLQDRTTGVSQTLFMKNAVFDTDGGNHWEYVETGVASMFQLDQLGAIGFYTASSGTAGNTISWNRMFNVTDDGILVTPSGSGTTYYTPSHLLHVKGDALIEDDLTIGAGAAGVDYTLTFDGETNDGVITWKEDEDYFQFADDILIDTNKWLYLGDATTGYLYARQTDTGNRAYLGSTASGGLTVGGGAEKLGFFGVTPVTQPVPPALPSVPALTGTDSVDLTALDGCLDDIVASLQELYDVLVDLGLTST